MTQAALSLNEQYSLPRFLLVLTFVTGIVDAVSVLGLGRVFTANMTGNVVFLGFAVAGVSEFSIARSLTALAAFLAGAVLGGRLGSRMAEPGRLRWLRTAAACEAALLVVAGLASIGFNLASAPLTLHLHALIVLTAVAMGLRNATVRRLAVPDLTTTVLTLTLTGIAADSSLARGKNPRFRYRAASVVFMFSGAVVGALLLRLGPAAPLLLSGLLVLIIRIGLLKGEPQ